MYLRRVVLLSVVALSACGGAGGTSATAPTGAWPGVVAPANSAQLVPTSFAVGLAASASASNHRTPKYVGAGSASVQIALNSVNGGAPPIGLTTTVTSSITPANCPCSVSGPLVPPGSDAFTFTTYDGPNATGNVVATFTNTYTIAAGSANNGNTVTLLGVPHSFTISGLPAAAAGTVVNPVAFTLAVFDADGNQISGTYANTVTVTESDTTGANGIEIAGAATPFGTSVALNASTDQILIRYAGQAIAPAVITASAPGATSRTASFAPVLSPIVYSGPLNGASAPELDLFAPSGTGSTGTFTASETGWTGPYNNTFSATTAGCATIGTISPASGTSFTFTAVASPVAGTCSITLSDGAGQTKSVIATYTSSGFGVN
jgi:hypothetical protein